MRAETYCNLFSLSVEHFNAVLDQYPLMRRTMESIAAERLNKIGKNPSIVSQREDLQTDLKVVNELLILSTQSPSDDSENCDPESSSNLGVKKLPRPKSELCFPRLTSLTEMGVLKLNPAIQRSETFYQSSNGLNNEQEKQETFQC